MTLKELLSAVMQECGFRAPNAFVTSSNDAISSLVALANRSARNLSDWDWQALRVYHTITLTTATQYDLPSDFRKLVDDTAWSQSGNRPMDLPTDDVMWTYLKNHTGATGLRYKGKIIGGKLEVLNPTAGDIIAFDYISSNPIKGSDDERKARFNKDDDVWLLDGDMLILDIVWRFKKGRGLDYSDEKDEAERYKRGAQGRDEGAQTISTTGDTTSTLNEPYYDLYR